MRLEQKEGETEREMNRRDKENEEQKERKIDRQGHRAIWRQRVRYRQKHGVHGCIGHRESYMLCN